MRQYLTIKGKFYWADLNRILGKSERGLHSVTDESKPPCGLAPGILSYKGYYKWKEPIGGYSAHVVKHTDGICFSGSLDVDQDWEFAKELYEKVLAHISKKEGGKQ